MVCEICGYPIDDGMVCIRCIEKPPEYTKLRSIYEYREELRNTLHHLKYDSDLGVGEILAGKCAKQLKKLNWNIDMIIPVPLGKNRRKERGYNQAAMIAYPMALMLGIHYGNKKLIRVKETVSQVDFNAEQRRMNVHDAFRAPGPDLQGKSILVIDDVITTGSTMSECAHALKKAGAINVYGLSVVRTMIKM
jgi:ComF family protein